MKCKRVSFIIFCLISFACSKNETSETNEFIQDFLDTNSIRLYKSEINRVKVNYFPSSSLLVYSFWKREKFDENGSLFLHLYPENKNDLEEHRKTHGFINLPIGDADLFYHDKPYFYYFESLQLPFGLSSIRTGQYSDIGKTWKSDFDERNVLSKEYLANSFLLKNRNDKEVASQMDKGFEVMNPIYGPVVFQKNGKNKISVHFNASLNRFTYLIKASVKQDKVLFINLFNKGVLVKREVLSFNEPSKLQEFKIINYDLPFTVTYDKIEIGEEVNGVKSVWKAIEKNKLIYNSFTFNGKSNNGTNVKDSEIEIVYNLISSNVPLIYSNEKNNIGLYLNEHNSVAYLVGFKMKNFNELGLKINLESSDQLSYEVNIENSFSLKGETKQIVVHKLELPNGISKIDLRSKEQIVFSHICKQLNN